MKHLRKVTAALEARQKSAPNGPGYKKPGSMNRRKSGYQQAPKK